MIRSLSVLLVSLTAAFACIAQDAELALPEGFSATVFHDGIGSARHLAVRGNGDVYVVLRYRPANPARNFDGSIGGIVALRDTDGDGKADVTETFGPKDTGTGVGIHNDYLYFSSDQAVFRIPLEEGKLVPEGAPVIMAGGFPVQRAHAAKSITLDNEGNMYVNSGAPSNSCQEEIRTPGSPGRNPCPELNRSAGIWKFRADTIRQDQLRNGERFVTGTRNVVALGWNPIANKLYFTMHGRDQLDQLWPEHFTAEQRIELPAEEFHSATGGENIGWPYTYFDPMRNARMVSPEYGGDGEMESDNPDYQVPLGVFPAHWAPDDLLIYTGDAFPNRYHGGAFIAFHGSWNRAPEPQGGYNVVFVPLDKEGNIADDWEIFADGFKGAETVASPGEAVYRPVGLAQGPDGALYISDSEKGRIWKVTYSAAP